MAASITSAARLGGTRIISKLLKIGSQDLPLLSKQLHTSLVYNVAGIPIKMPSLSPTMSEGTIVKWLKQEGDTVEPGDIICDIQTDKAVVSFEVEEEGILAKILLKEDSKDVPVGRMIAVMVDPGEDWKAVEVPAEAEAPPAPAAAAPPPTPTPAPAAPAPEPAAKKEFSGLRHAGAAPTTVGPAVRTLLELYDIDAANVTATGRHGLLKSDVLAYITQHKLSPQPPTPVPAPGSVSRPAAPASAPAPAGDAAYIDIPLSSMRKTIAKRLTQSKTEIPHAYMQSEARFDRLLALRKELKAEGVQASLNDYIIKAVALCLRLQPQLNCVWSGDQLQRPDSVDISVAVATDAGLITPIVVDAAGSSVSAISGQVQDLAARARLGKLKPHEFMGGSFTISNLGMFGIGEFSAIINPPQCGILAVGGGRSQLAADGGSETWLTSTLSYDARAVSEPEAAAFMETLAHLLTNPDLLVTDARRELQQLG
ncbi:pyruvate dehydrogenase protein X component, mitochondrial-like isoform X1 [Amphibalanus amphitrite]|uniref:pyruvate dehydrogenase protein X component, mitochondrial-like isoform X1 n=1 Tax=Amphibalanus amphitrite TaxID=1232801 RepID=UPI001C916EAC|nr:pyruvate dehydrogenase protein X component, mitochondrial-like isoform X1 [Amphibalanus amphitrite]XP_043233412.1 pyruvate dehydrogenase protein X component, mitochondrial-like isoform X1 [Amphibalanus amphitrite]XP_043233414.1 pyruvate dehydrogenase protein X component, mitochondrial-like isoform X1 [Amphibalanus amphitrite]